MFPKIHTKELTSSLVWFFNPGYEASLSGVTANYTPPRSVCRFRRDLATLPIYMTSGCDYVMVADDMPEQYRTSQIISELSGDDALQPWGWASELKSYLPKGYVLPFTVDEMRALGSRHQSLSLWREIVRIEPALFSHLMEPMECSAMPNSLPLHRAWVLKDEYSSSGRGVRFFSDEVGLGDFFASVSKSRSKRYYIEPYYEIVEDRGYEFYMSATGEVRYLGGSEFVTEKGKYIANRLQPADQLETKWQATPTTPSHENYILLLSRALSRLSLYGYSGPIGVDTAVVANEEGALELLPCIEVNIRPTMGHLALALSERDLPSEHGKGYFQITTLTPAQRADWLNVAPLYMESTSLLARGVYPLTPVTEETRFVATLTIE
ncbi:MAG: hypothetical protein Q4D93_06015 [Porphyromonas sp.]|nr:hypothetical protein [Porphyromonas sp.]